MTRWLPLLTLLCAGSALANDTVVAGGYGVGLVPVKTSDVYMASEDITMTFDMKGDPEQVRRRGMDPAWRVVAKYVFVNPSSAEVSLQFGFPEGRCVGDPNDPDVRCPRPEDLHFRDMKTLVRGVPVAHRKGNIKKNDAWAKHLGDVWLFDVTLGPGEQVPIVHEYGIKSSVDSSNGIDAPYVTRTGALWGRPIGRARFTFRYPARVCTVIPPQRSPGTVPVPFASFRLLEENGQLVSEASYEVRDWTPDGDVSFYAQPCTLVRDYWENDVQTICPAHELLWRYAIGEAFDRPVEVQPLSHDALIQELAKLSDAQLRLCKNYPFAAYGRPFQDRELSRAFYKSDEPALSQGPLTPFVASAHYTDKLLTPGDWRWVKVVDEVLAKRSAPPAPSAAAASPALSADKPAPLPPPAAATKAGCSGCAIAGGEPTAGWAWFLLTALVAVFARTPRRGRRG